MKPLARRLALVAVCVLPAAGLGAPPAAAATAAQVVTAIETFGLQATSSGNTVTVTGEKTNATTTLTLTPNADVTVVWRARLVGTAGPLVTLNGTGALVVDPSGYLENQTTSATTLNVAAAATVTVAGGEVRAGTTGVAIVLGGAAAHLAVNSGLVHGGNEAVRMWQSNQLVTVSGGTLSSAAGGTTATIRCGNSVTGQSATVTGGLVTSSGPGSALQSCANSQVTGGTVSNTGTGRAITQEATGRVFVDAKSALNPNGATVTTASGAWYATTGSLGVVIERAATQLNHLAGDNQDLTIVGAAARAVWDVNGGVSGISYERSTNSGFIPIAGVSVAPGTQWLSVDGGTTRQVTSSNAQTAIQAALDGTPAGGTVTVTGTLTSVVNGLTVNIGAGKRLVWRASLSGATGSTALLTHTGAGELEIPTGGSLNQTGTGNASTTNAVRCTGAGGSVTVSGGQVAASIAGAIYGWGNSNFRVHVAAGSVSSDTSAAITYTGTSGSVTISGGSVTSAATGSGIGVVGFTSANTNTNRLIVTGGLVENTSTNVNSRAVNSSGLVFVDAPSGQPFPVKVNNSAGTKYNLSTTGYAVERIGTRSEYAPGTSDDLKFDFASNTTAYWAFQDGHAGVLAGRGSATTFIPIAGVTITGFSDPDPDPEISFHLTDALVANLPAPGAQGSLTIYKYSGVGTKAGNGVWHPVANPPLAGVRYRVERVTRCQGVEMDLSNLAAWRAIQALGATPAAAAASVTSCAQTALPDLATNELGHAATGPIPVGLYLVTEISAPPGVTIADAPFLITIPLPNQTGDAWIWDVVVQPKNLVPGVATKKISDYDVIQVGDPITWHLTFPIPDYPVENYVMLDLLDSRIDCLESAAFDATLWNSGGQQIAINRETDWSAVAASAPGTDPAQVLILAQFHEPDGIAKLNSARGGHVVVELTCKLADGAVGEVPNSAGFWVNELPDYAALTAEGWRGLGSPTGETNQVWHRTGTLVLHAYDAQTGAPLAGASYQIWASGRQVLLDGVDQWTTGPTGTIEVAGLRYSNFAGNDWILDSGRWLRFDLVEVGVPAEYQARGDTAGVEVTEPVETVDLDYVKIDTVSTLPLRLPLIGSVGSGWLVLICVTVLAAGYWIVVRRTQARA